MTMLPSAVISRDVPGSPQSLRTFAFSTGENVSSHLRYSAGRTFTALA
jgi:hypothetical protein